MIKDKFLNKIIEAELIRKNQEKMALHEPSGKLSASMLFQPVRFQVMKSLGIPRKDIDPYTLGKFERGNRYEAVLNEYASKVPGLVIETQKPVEYRGVVGFADMIVNTNLTECKKGIMPWEIKSVANSKLTRIKKTGEIDWHYKLQGCLYALATKSDYYAIVIVANDSDSYVDVSVFGTSELAGEVNRIISDYNLAMLNWKEQKKLPELVDTQCKWATSPDYAMYGPEWTDEAIIKYLEDKNVSN